MERKKETDRRPERKSNRRKKHLQFHDEKKCEIDKTNLPSDVIFKGYSKKIFQGIKTELHNVLIKREVYYSPSEHKTYLAPLPAGYSSDTYTPELKATIVSLKHASGMTEPKILEYLTSHGITISAGSISNILLGESEKFISQKNEIYEAGLKSSLYQQTDTTGAREDGINKQVHIVCNERYTAFFTEDKRDRKTVLDVLRNHRIRKFRLNTEAFELMRLVKVNKAHIKDLLPFKTDATINEAEIQEILLPLKGDTHKIYECAYIAGYHAELEISIPILLADDAPVYRLISNDLSLCWIHAGRHFKKLTPVIDLNRKITDAFIKKFWNFYRELLNYKLNPYDEYAKILESKFQLLFETKTGYEALDERIACTLANKENLLLVLKFPFLPLHNNASELAARAIVRQRDISLQTKSPDGTKARDAYLTVIQTAKKLGVNLYQYILSVVSNSVSFPSLAQLVLCPNHLPP